MLLLLFCIISLCRVQMPLYLIKIDFIGWGTWSLTNPLLTAVLYYGAHFKKDLASPLSPFHSITVKYSSDALHSLFIYCTASKAWMCLVCILGNQGISSAKEFILAWNMSVVFFKNDRDPYRDPVVQFLKGDSHSQKVILIFSIDEMYFDVHR